MDKVVERRYTRLDRDKGPVDEDFEALKNLSFAPDHTLTRKKRIKSTSRPSSPPPTTLPSTIIQALTIPRTVTPLCINIHSLNFVFPNKTANSWGQAVGLLNLGGNLGALPKGAQDILPKFNGVRKVMTEDHMSSFHSACGVVNVPTKDVAVKLFVQTFRNAAAN